MRNLSGKCILVTGGARGIGAATAKRYVEEGSRVVVLDCYEPALEEI
jgi:NAD(P)-dependent dehydrogenase (short-subunit alcohol dehydrogenase family)